MVGTRAHKVEEVCMNVIFEIIFNPVKLLIYLKWVLRYLLKGNWRMGTEIAYWEYSLKSNPKPKNYETKRFSLEIIPLLNILDDSFDDESKPYNVLDVGSGPRTLLIEGYERNLYNLKGLDPLANEYKKFIGEKEYLVQGKGENIDSIFSSQSFHMSYASNSLDHTDNPLRCFRNMVNATIVNGIIVIRSAIKEGSRLNWAGLHQHDLWFEHGKLMHSERNGEIIDLTEGLPIVLHSEITAPHNKTDGVFVVVYRRVSAP